jgi:hypothetical protein
MSDYASYRRFHTSEGVKRWAKLCGYKTHGEAAEALGLPLRSWMRFAANGLPRGSRGLMAASLMGYILKDCVRDRAEKKAPGF